MDGWKMPLVCAEHPAPLHDASCEEFMPYKFVLFALKKSSLLDSWTGLCNLLQASCFYTRSSMVWC
ncbi:unnamed protein product, partial [Vitis vinifera]|uniref:Uncharacterized protein n=1 Tax=Vitis vinifera TaxID=29760 RepID=D7T9H9_VITVI